MASNAQTTPEASPPAMTITQQHEANILRALEISPYELAFLEKHLLNNDWIPNATDEAAINDAVFDFCESYLTNTRYQFPERVNRLNFLFRAFTDDEEMYDPDDYADYQEMRDRRLGRETAKYHAVRSLIADLTYRKNGVRDPGAQVIVEYVRDVFSYPLLTMAPANLIIARFKAGVNKHPKHIVLAATQSWLLERRRGRRGRSCMACEGTNKMASVRGHPGPHRS
jgi:hypothetical protein